MIYSVFHSYKFVFLFFYIIIIIIIFICASLYISWMRGTHTRGRKRARDAAAGISSTHTAYSILQHTRVRGSRFNALQRLIASTTTLLGLRPITPATRGKSEKSRHRTLSLSLARKHSSLIFFTPSRAPNARGERERGFLSKKKNNILYYAKKAHHAMQMLCAGGI